VARQTIAAAMSLFFPTASMKTYTTKKTKHERKSPKDIFNIETTSMKTGFLSNRNNNKTI
jgi:hypothetical protein